MQGLSINHDRPLKENIEFNRSGTPLKANITRQCRDRVLVRASVFLQLLFLQLLQLLVQVQRE